MKNPFGPEEGPGSHSYNPTAVYEPQAPPPPHVGGGGGGGMIVAPASGPVHPNYNPAGQPMMPGYMPMPMQPVPMHPGHQPIAMFPPPPGHPPVIQQPIYPVGPPPPGGAPGVNGASAYGTQELAPPPAASNGAHVAQPGG